MIAKVRKMMLMMLAGLVAAVAVIGRLFALPTSAARRNGMSGKFCGVKFFPVFCVVSLTVILTACSPSFESIRHHCQNEAKNPSDPDTYNIIKYDSCMDDYKIKQLFLINDLIIGVIVALVIIIIVVFVAYSVNYSHPAKTDTNARRANLQTDTNTHQASLHDVAKDSQINLHDVAKDGQTEKLLSGIEAGKDINAKDSYGRTPLHWAANYNQTETACAIINAGANLYELNNRGKTALDIAIATKGKDSEIARILWEAMERQGGK